MDSQEAGQGDPRKFPAENFSRRTYPIGNFFLRPGSILYGYFMKGTRPDRKKQKKDTQSSQLSSILFAIIFIVVFVFFSWMYISQYF